jgi:hypothetical protein
MLTESPAPTPAALTAEQLRRYRQLRDDGVPAIQAHRAAAATSPVVRYRSGPGEAITLLFDDRPDLAGFTVTATAEPDPEPDIDWLGEFTDTRSPHCVEVNRGDRHAYRYFLPTYTAAQRRADLSRRGYSRARAQELADEGVRDDARLARVLEHRVICVEARKAGVLLGAAVMGTDFAPDTDLEGEIAAVIDDYGLVDEAVEQARTALPPLIAALAA